METYQILKLNNDNEYETVVEYDTNGQLQIKGLSFEYPGNAVLIQDGEHYLIETLENAVDGTTIEILQPEVTGDDSQTIVYSQDDIQHDGKIMDHDGGSDGGDIIVPDINQISEPPPLYYPKLDKSAFPHYGESSSQASNLEINIVCKVCKLDFVGADVFNEHMNSHQLVQLEQIEFKHVIKKDIPDDASNIEIAELSDQIDNQKIAYPCALCDKKYIWHKFLVTHSKSHKIPGEFNCTLCGVTYNGLYYDHMRTHILGYISRECSKCKMSFTTLKSYKLHMKSIHMEEGDSIVRKHKCEICDKNYKSLSYLREHQRIHTGEKP